MLRFVADLTQSFFSHQDQPARRKTIATASHQYENLEARQLLASISFDPSNGVLALIGDNTADVASVSQIVNDPSSDFVIQVDLNGQSETFINTPITSIFFEGNDGNDEFVNNTSLPSFARGGLGNDILVGGSGIDRLVGSEGDDTLEGNFGADILVGNAGNDTLSGDGGEDRLFGGAGEDLLDGDEGNDFLSGGDDADTINGGAGNDTGVGGAGDDTLNGGTGDDGLFGTGGEDELFGDEGDDILGGNDGNDLLEGGLGLDRLFGEAGNDRLNGGEGNDRLFGREGDDTLNGGAGDDLLAGDFGEDVLVGGDGLNTIFGGDGNDQIFGGNDRDLLFGQGGDDLIRGANGDDVLNGGAGDDELHGGLGNDRLAGLAGADQLYGELGDDALFGGDGNDSLVGGVGDNIDILAGNSGRDYFISSSESNILDFNINNDVEVEFRNGTSSWTNREVEVLNGGLFRLQQITGTTQVLASPLLSEPLVFIKQTTIAPQAGGRLATNQEVSITELEFNPDTAQVDAFTLSERQITFAEWDETDDAANLARLDEVPREVAFMWADAEPITAVLPRQAGFYDNFLLISGWTEDRPDNIEFFDVTPDGSHFYLQAAPFAEPAGTLSPEEDFATTWKLAVQQFASGTGGTNNGSLVPKLASVDQFFTLLSSVNPVISSERVSPTLGDA